MTEATIHNGTRFGPDQPAHYCGKPGRSGPPKGNTNGMRHGLKTGRLPTGCDYIANRSHTLRRELEAAVIAVRGSVSVRDAGIIQTIIRLERHACLAQKWLRDQFATLTAAEKLAYSEAITKASESRDRAIDKLKLDAPPRPPWLQPEGGEAC